MNKLNKQTVYVPVSVKDELPECDSQHNRCYLSKRVGILSDEGVDSTQYYREYDKQNNLKSVGWNDEEDFGIITHWLKEETNKYVLSEEELIKVISDAFDAGIEKGNHNGNYFDAPLNKEEYLKQILNNE